MFIIIRLFIYFLFHSIMFMKQRAHLMVEVGDAAAEAAEEGQGAEVCVL